MANTDIVSNKTKQYWIIGSVCFASFIGLLDNYIVNISLPSISHSLNVSTSQVAYVTLIYLLVLTSTLIVFGKIIDRIGPRKIFTGGYIVFTLGSLLCGLSPTINVLLLSRVIQGLGASMLYASSFTIIPKYLPVSIRGMSFGLISTASAFGIMLGAPLGGIISGTLGWHWIFMINVPVGIIAIIVSFCVIPASDRNESTEKQFDIPGAVLIFIALLFFIFGLNNAQEAGWHSLPIIISLVVSVITFVIFILWESKITYPLVDLALFNNINVSLTNIMGFLGMAVFAGANFLMPFYLILLKGFSEQQAGMMVLIYSVVYLILTPNIGRWSDHVKPNLLCATGMLVGVFAFLEFAFTLGLNSIWPAVIFLILQAVAYGFFISPNNNLLIAVSPEDKIGVSSSIFKTITNLSLICGVLLFNTIFTLCLPVSIADSTKSILSTGVNPVLMAHGFSEAFLVGAVLCLLAAVICFNINKVAETKELPMHSGI